MLVVRISLMSFLYDIWEYERSIYMAEHIINFSIDAVGDRNKVRMKVVNELSDIPITLKLLMTETGYTLEYPLIFIMDLIL